RVELWRNNNWRAKLTLVKVIFKSVKSKLNAVSKIINTTRDKYRVPYKTKGLFSRNIQQIVDGN
ncbi:hypothetical protein QUG97_24905, partial [Klebsiella michiganensis]|uniref:hypothetical protein n=1 Tax=Klebsiella michiganensis TaxID=1134687 RepID=UPI0025A022F3